MLLKEKGVLRGLFPYNKKKNSKFKFLSSLARSPSTNLGVLLSLCSSYEEWTVISCWPARRYSKFSKVDFFWSFNWDSFNWKQIIMIRSVCTQQCGREEGWEMSFLKKGGRQKLLFPSFADRRIFPWFCLLLIILALYRSYKSLFAAVVEDFFSWHQRNFENFFFELCFFIFFVFTLWISSQGHRVQMSKGRNQ